MNAVLYTQDLVPITVVDVNPWLWEMLLERQHIVLPVLLPVVRYGPDEDPRAVSPLRMVRIHGERIRRGQHETLMLFTDDEEAALLLRSEFLPGQRGEMKSRERSAFAEGFFRALYDFRG